VHGSVSTGEVTGLDGEVSTNLDTSQAEGSMSVDQLPESGSMLTVTIDSPIRVASPHTPRVVHSPVPGPSSSTLWSTPLQPGSTPRKLFLQVITD